MAIRQEQRVKLFVVQVINGKLQFHPVGAPGCAIIIWLFLACLIGLTPWAMSDPFIGTAWWLGPVAVLSIVSWSWRRSFQHNQKHRDKIARLVINGEATFPYVVYLRSFSQPNDAEWVREFETMIARAFEPKEVFITLESGHDQEPISLDAQVYENGLRVGYLGAGRIQVANEDWKRVIVKLLNEATMIVMIPAIGEGMLFEAQWIMTQGMCSQTIFVMPPSAWGMQIDDNRKEWNEASKMFMSIGIMLPPYNPKGMFFTVDGRGRVSRSVELEFDIEMAVIPGRVQARTLRKKIALIRQKGKQSKSSAT